MCSISINYYKAVALWSLFEHTQRMKNNGCCLVQWKNVCSNRACASVHLEQQVQVGAQV